MTVGNDVLIGEINLENKSYFIDQTNIIYNGKVVHVVYSSDAFKERKILTYCTDSTYNTDASDEITLNLSMFGEKKHGRAQ